MDSNITSTVNLYQTITLLIIMQACNDNIKHINTPKIDEGSFYNQVLENLSFDKTIKSFIKTFNQENSIIDHFSIYGLFSRQIDNINEFIQIDTFAKTNTNVVFNPNYRKIVQIVIWIILEISCKNTFEYSNCSYDIFKGKKPNFFVDTVIKTRSIDYAINEFVKTLYSDKKFIKLCQLYETKLTDRFEKDEFIESRIVTTIITHFGLYEVFNLKKEFYDLVHNKIIQVLFTD
jgi:hypothetical protein